MGVELAAVNVPRSDFSKAGFASALAAEPFDVMRRAGQETRTGNLMPRLAPFGGTLLIAGWLLFGAMLWKRGE